MVILNKKPVNKILLNKKNISKILLNKKVVFDAGLNPDDYEGYLNFELPEIDGISDYFIFCLMTHYPITKANERFQYAIQNLAELRITYFKESTTLSPIEFKNFEINGSTDLNSDWIGSHIGDYVNNSENLNFLFEADRVVSSKFSKGIVAFLEGSHEHILPNAAIKAGFRNCAVLGDAQLISAFLIGQANLELPEGYLDKEYEPLEKVACDISLSMDNNAVGNSAYNIYSYCIKNDGHYKLLSMNSTYNRNTNLLTFNERLTVFDSAWFDGIPGT